MLRRHLFASSPIILLPFLCSAAAPPPAPGLDITAAFTPTGDLSVTFHNTGAAPCTFHPGISLGNGQALWPMCLSLVVTPKGGAARELTYKGGAIGGRVDDWLVPLPPGASYTLRLAPADFIYKPDGVPATPPQPALPGESLQVRFTSIPAAYTKPPPANLWTAQLTSAAMSAPAAKP
ncbi:MAG TPA: hypothetical protein VH253_11725 [Phycisphaerae bacterium]|nr:hypothetical protein [Phycisphaerae bacterium]